MLQELVRKVPSANSLVMNLKVLNRLGQSTLPLNEDISNPTYFDQTYINRKKDIVNSSFSYKMGEPIFQVRYTQSENRLWRRMYKKISELQREVTISKYLQNKIELERYCDFGEKIPSMQLLSTYLKSKTGFRIKPVPGIIPQRDFLNCLAFRVFCSSQFIRHHLSEEFAPEPDIIHEYVGHIPYLADQKVASVTHKIGLLSLGASDEDIMKLGNLYLYTLEFGLCKQAGKIKTYGAAITACIADLKRIRKGQYTCKKFEPEKDWARPFNYQSQQTSFLLSQSLDEVLLKLEDFGNTLTPSFDCTYDDIMENVIVKGDQYGKK